MEVLKMQEINDNTFFEEQEEDVIREQEDQAEESSKENDIQMIIKNVEEIKEDEEREKDEKVERTFLHEKDLNENLVETLINTDLADGHVSDNDTDNLQDLWQAKIEVNKSSDSINSTSGNLSSNHIQLSSNNIYLKKVLSKPLIQALCEIVAKKPADPVEYLGHWLLHYKICEERALQQKESESEVSIHMEKLELEKQKIENEVDLFIERKAEEEYGEDRNYIDYEIMF